MNKNLHLLTSVALFFLCAGIFTSVSILSIYQVLIVIPIIWVWKLKLSEKNLSLPKSSYWLLLFFGVALFSLIMNFDLVPKPSKNFGRLKYFLYGVGMIPVLQLWVSEASEKTKKILFQTFCLSIVVAFAYAVNYMITTGLPRATGLTDTMRYGYGSGMIHLTLLSAILHREKFSSWFNPKIAIVTFVLGFLGMYLTYTRGALLGFLCGLPFVLYFYKRSLGIWLGGLAVLGVLTLGGFYLFGSGNYNSRFLTNKSNSSDVIRRSQWKAAMIATQEKPILGWGLSNFHSQLARIKNQYDLDAKDYNDAHSHNLFLEISSGTGLIGLFVFLLWLFTWAYEAFKMGGLVRALIVPFGVAFVVSSQFEVTFDANNASMIFFLYALSFFNLNQKIQPAA